MPRQAYTAEVKEQDVRYAQSVGAVVVAMELGLVEPMLRRWVKKAGSGTLYRARTKGRDARADEDVAAAGKDGPAEVALRKPKQERRRAWRWMDCEVLSALEQT
jgi:transposase-like protein